MKKIGRSKVLALCSYKTANAFSNNLLSPHNLKAFLLLRFLRTDIVRLSGFLDLLGASLPTLRLTTTTQQPVPRDFPLFKRCERLVINCNVAIGRHSIYLRNSSLCQLEF